MGRPGRSSGVLRMGFCWQQHEAWRADQDSIQTMLDAARFANLTNVTSHELAEVITDPFVPPQLRQQWAIPGVLGDEIGTGWHTDDAEKQEISDICQGKNLALLGQQGMQYQVASFWSEQQQQCFNGVTARTR